MRRNSLRRLGALVLALALTLSLVLPAWADDQNTTSLEITGESTVEIGKSIELTANWAGQEPTSPTYTWTCIPSTTGVTLAGDTNKVTVTVDDTVAAGTKVTINLTASWSDGAGGSDTAEGTYEVTITEPAFALDKETLSLPVGRSETLTATGASAGTVSWKSDKEDVATVDANGKVTAVKEGTATITAKVGDKTATCAVTVTPPEARGVTFSNNTTIVRGREDTNPWELSVTLTPTGSVLPEGGKITWSAAPKSTSPGATPPSGWEEAAGATVRLTDQDPGEYTFTASYNGVTATRDVTVSGIVLNAERVTMLEGATRTLAVENMYGFAKGSITDVVWTSSDPSTVTVSTTGELQSWKLGTAIITANRNGYTATCEVEVTEDKESIIDGLSATHSEPLTFDTLYTRINQISQQKTADRDTNNNPISGTGSSLNYITNVTVPTEQGTLYYNYDSESNTGAGVGATDRFAYQSSASIQQTLKLLYFVPRQGFSGTAEITATGWAQNGTSFPLTIKVGVEAQDGVRYKTSSGQPAFFLGSDFNAYCRAQKGRDLSYVTFNLPQSSQGVLYYGYTSKGQYEGRVTTGTQYGRSGRNTIDDVCFVPDEAFIGTVRVSFRGVDTAGNSVTGQVVIDVTAPGGLGEASNVFMTGQWGEPVTLEPSLFSYACQATIGDTLSYVRFQLPDYSEGVLYHDYKSAGNYGSRVDSNTRYYYSGTPGLGGVTFVPASNDADRVGIPYTGYGVGGTSYTGTLYITLGEEKRTAVYYSVSKGGSVSFSVSDFNNVALYQMGTSLEYVTFQLPGTLTSSLGQLYYNYRGSNIYNTPVTTGSAYWRNPSSSWSLRLDRISFHAGTTAGIATVPFTGYSVADSYGRRQSFQGTIMLQVGAVSPSDVNLYGYTSDQIRVSSSGIIAACRQVMSQSLSYIQITSLPTPEQGQLYYGYYGYKTGTEVKVGDRYYYTGTPSIDQLSFIPRGGYSGEAVVTYIGYNLNGGEQVSGRIVLNISRSTSSRIFNDLGSHSWAVDAVEFLYRNGTVQGVGGGRYNPTGLIRKGDFTLMLVRTFGFRDQGNAHYTDVPENSYYAQAIKIATQLGIVQGSGGKFEPNKALTRQEAMKMVYLAMKADGSLPSNGLTADLTDYRDSGQIDPDAREAIGTLVLLGVVQGNGNGMLNPRGTLNRAETASLMHALMTL